MLSLGTEPLNLGTSPAQIAKWAKAWQDACFRPGDPGYADADSLRWQEVRAFDLHLIDGFDAGDYDQLFDEFREHYDAAYFGGMCQAVKDGTIEESFIAEGTDGRFYVWEGNHRTGIAHVLGVSTMPAFVGYRKGGEAQWE